MFNKSYWNRTWVLWYHKRPLCQLRHNHFPKRRLNVKRTLKDLEDFDQKHNNIKNGTATISIQLLFSLFHLLLLLLLQR